MKKTLPTIAGFEDARVESQIMQAVSGNICRLLRFARMPSAGSRVSGMSLWVSFWSPETQLQEFAVPRKQQRTPANRQKPSLFMPSLDFLVLDSAIPPQTEKQISRQPIG